MIVTVLVDDEPPIADGLRELLAREFADVLSVSACYSASVVTSRIKAQPVDLVIADINMPGMDGLTLAAFLREHYPQTRVILLTGYSSFDYVYQANRLGGVRYVLKIADDATIVGEVRRVVEEIEEARVSRSRAEWVEGVARRLEPIAERDFIERIVRGESGGGQTWREEVERLGLSIDADTPVLPLVASGAGLDSDAVLLAMQRDVLDRLGPSVRSVSGPVEAWRGVGAALLQPAAPAADLDVGLREIHTAWIDALQRRSPGASASAEGLNVIVNEAFVSIATAGLSLRRLLSLCGFLYRGSGGVYTPEGAMRARLEDGQGVAGLSARAIARIEAAFDTLEWEQYRSEVDDLLAVARESEGSSVWGRHQYRLGLRFLASVLIERLPRGAEVVHLEAELLAAADSDTSVPGMTDRYRVVFDRIARLRGEHASRTSHSHATRLALSYIDESLHTGLSVPVIAEHLSLSPGYLSRLFKSETGRTILAYIPDRRLDRAKSLLLNTNLRVREIAQRIGLTSADYFIRFFRRRTGVPPQVYRERRIGS